MIESMGRIIPKIWWKITHVWNHQPVVHGSCPIDEHIVRTIISIQPSRMFLVFFNPAFWLLKLSKKIGWSTIFFWLNSLNYLDVSSVSSVKTGRNHHWIGLVGHILIGDHRFPHEIWVVSHELWGFPINFSGTHHGFSFQPIHWWWLFPRPLRQQALQEGGDYPGRWSYGGGHSWRGHGFFFIHLMFEMEISWISSINLNHDGLMMG